MCKWERENWERERKISLSSGKLLFVYKRTEFNKWHSIFSHHFSRGEGEKVLLKKKTLLLLFCLRTKKCENVSAADFMCMRARVQGWKKGNLRWNSKNVSRCDEVCKHFWRIFKFRENRGIRGFVYKSSRNESITMELLCVITSDLTFRESLNHFTLQIFRIEADVGEKMMMFTMMYWAVFQRNDWEMFDHYLTKRLGKRRRNAPKTWTFSPWILIFRFQMLNYESASHLRFSCSPHP